MMFAAIYSDINSIKSCLFHLTEQPDSPKIQYRKSKMELFQRLNS